MCGLSPNGLFSTSIIMGGRVPCLWAFPSLGDPPGNVTTTHLGKFGKSLTQKCLAVVIRDMLLHRMVIRGAAHLGAAISLLV